MRRLMSVLLVMGLGFTSMPLWAQEDGGESDESVTLRRKGPTRIEFDPRAVEGQTKKAGAIYLFQRKDAEIKSLVKRRKSFRAEVIKKLDE